MLNIQINHAESKAPEFHLQNSKISYIAGVLENGHLGSLYYGSQLTHASSFAHMQTVTNESVPITPKVPSSKYGLALELVRAEYPAYGQGDFRTPAIEVKAQSGSTISDFKYKSHELFQGKPKIDGLPQTYVESKAEALTLVIILEDEVLQAELVLKYSIFRDYPVITRSTELRNLSSENLIINRLASSSFDLPNTDPNTYNVFHFSGNWSREMEYVEQELKPGKLSIESTRGTSSAIHQPFIGIKKGTVSETHGEVYGISLVYSGNHLCSAEMDQYGVIRTSVGINPFNFDWNLKPNQSFQTPEAVLVYSDEGLSGMSLAFNNLYRNRLARGKYRNEERPILLNNWEATYFDFDEDKILNIAQKGKELGIELFVLDDGWFGNRDSDTKALGDWEVNLKKLPSGIKGLAEKIGSMGLKFGLWFEPEMVNKDSDLYRAHPDWILEVPGYPNTPSRFQHTLDLSRTEVCNYIYDSVSKILANAKVSYVKWDMNRPMTEVMSYSQDSDHQGEVGHRYMLGLYALLERLIHNFPDVLFESCASGGNRFDAGMLHYMPQAWTSDNTDAITRLSIQHSASMIYPISSIGAHVSAVPNHQTARVTDLKTRANVAFFGAFGYELDLNLLSYEAQIEVKEQIAFYKTYRSVFQFGNFYRLKSPYEGEVTAWMCVNSDKSTAVVGFYRVKVIANSGSERLTLTGLDPKMKYKIESTSSVLQSHAFGDELMRSGLVFGNPLYHVAIKTLDSGDYKSKMIVLHSVSTVKG